MSGQARTFSGQEILCMLRLLRSSRDRALFAIGVYTGLRIGEIIALKANDVFSAGDVKKVMQLTRIKQKNVVMSEIPLAPKLRQVLQLYRRDCSKFDLSADLMGASVVSGWLFPSENSKDGHLTRGGAHNFLTYAYNQLSMTGVTTHSMRRTFLTSLLEAGVSRGIVKRLSGHSTTTHLSMYVSPKLVSLAEALETLNY